MSRPNDSFYRRIDVRRRYTDMDVVDAAIQRLAAQIERGLTAIQSSMAVAVTDYQFGASDGFQDMTFPLQVAINKVGENGGGTLFLPKGTYNLTDTVRINHDNVILQGEGVGTVLSFTVTAGTHFLEAELVERIGVRDLQLLNDGSAGLTSEAIHFTDVEEAIIHHVAFVDCNLCIHMHSCDGIDVAHCHDDNTTSVCVALDDAGAGTTDDISVQMNNFEANTTTLTYVTNITGGLAPRNVRFENNRPLPTFPLVVAAPGPAQTITRDSLFRNTDQYIEVSGAGATTVDTIEVTFPGDTRVIVATDALVTFLDTATAAGVNLHLSGANFVGGTGASAQNDTLSLYCDGTNWIETSRSQN